MVIMLLQICNPSVLDGTIVFSRQGWVERGSPDLHLLPGMVISAGLVVSMQYVHLPQPFQRMSANSVNCEPQVSVLRLPAKPGVYIFRRRSPGTVASTIVVPRDFRQEKFLVTMSEITSTTNDDKPLSTASGMASKHRALTVLMIGLGQMGRKYLPPWLDVMVTGVFHYSDGRLCGLIGR